MAPTGKVSQCSCATLDEIPGKPHSSAVQHISREKGGPFLDRPLNRCVSRRLETEDETNNGLIVGQTGVHTNEAVVDIVVGVVILDANRDVA